MAKGFYISKPLGILVIILGVAAVCTIIALSVVYAQEKNKNTGSSTENPTATATATTTAATTLDQSKPWPSSIAPGRAQIRICKEDGGRSEAPAGSGRWAGPHR